MTDPRPVDPWAAPAITLSAVIASNSGTVRPGGAGVGSSAGLGPSSEFGERWRFGWACRRLDRLAVGLRRLGWGTAQRYGQMPPVLHVFSSGRIGESVMVVRDRSSWWYLSSTGAWLGPCTEPWRAAESVTALLAVWGITPGSLRDAP